MKEVFKEIFFGIHTKTVLIVLFTILFLAFIALKFSVYLETLSTVYVVPILEEPARTVVS